MSEDEIIEAGQHHGRLMLAAKRAGDHVTMMFHHDQMNRLCGQMTALLKGA